MVKKLFDTIHLSNGSGKMYGIQSINTSTINNPFCNKMSQTDSVCKKCYASRYEKMRPALHNALIKNDELLSGSILPVQQLPTLNQHFIRIDSFGELINEIHFKNILNIALKNPDTIITLWTKRKNIVWNVLAKREKPENLIIIYSSPIIGKIAELPKYFNKVFTVFNKKEIPNNATINCGGKSCINCLTCYTKNDTVFVNEILK